MTYKTTGIIIKKRDLSEADRLLTIYTKDFGKILVKAKAVKKSQAKLKGHLELFLHSDLIFAEGKSLDIVIGAETIDNFFTVHHCLSALAGAYCLAELADRLIAGPEPDENIWRLILFSFQAINNENENVELVIKNFSAKILEFLGYGDFNQQNPFPFICSYIGSEINSFEFLHNVGCLIE